MKTTNTIKGMQQYREINQKIEKAHSDHTQAGNRKWKGHWKLIAVGMQEKT
jgi:hypothetical protein